MIISFRFVFGAAATQYSYCKQFPTYYYALQAPPLGKKTIQPYLHSITLLLNKIL